MSGEDDLRQIQAANVVLAEMRRDASDSGHVSAGPWWELSPPKEFAESAGTMRCRWCYNIFHRERRSLAEVEHLRRALLIAVTVPFDPPICDACYEKVVTSALPPEQVEKVGSSNSSHANLVLRNSVG